MSLKDYCVIVVVGTDLVRLVRDKESRKYLSSQMATQIELGLEIADMARQDIEDDEKPMNTFNGLMRQCVSRRLARMSGSGSIEMVVVLIR